MKVRALQVLLVIGLLNLATDMMAQSKAAPFKPNHNLNPQQTMGQHLFVQRCSICHLPHYTKSDPAGYAPNSGVSLDGVFKAASPEEEKTLKEHILKGSQKMPGFKYGLQPREIDDLIAYLKTI